MNSEPNKTSDWTAWAGGIILLGIIAYFGFHIWRDYLEQESFEGPDRQAITSIIEACKKSMPQCRSIDQADPLDVKGLPAKVLIWDLTANYPHALNLNFLSRFSRTYNENGRRRRVRFSGSKHIWTYPSDKKQPVLVILVSNYRVRRKIPNYYHDKYPGVESEAEVFLVSYPSGKPIGKSTLVFNPPPLAVRTIGDEDSPGSHEIVGPIRDGLQTWIANKLTEPNEIDGWKESDEIPAE